MWLLEWVTGVFGVVTACVSSVPYSRIGLQMLTCFFSFHNQVFIAYPVPDRQFLLCAWGGLQVLNNFVNLTPSWEIHLSTETAEVVRSWSAKHWCERCGISGSQTRCTHLVKFGKLNRIPANKIAVERYSPCCLIHQVKRAVCSTCVYVLPAGVKYAESSKLIPGWLLR